MDFMRLAICFVSFPTFLSMEVGISFAESFYALTFSFEAVGSHYPLVVYELSPLRKRFLL